MQSSPSKTRNAMDLEKLSTPKQSKEINIQSNEQMTNLMSSELKEFIQPDLCAKLSDFSEKIKLRVTQL